MDTANAVKDGKCLRYRHNWQEREADATTFIRALETRLAIVAEDLRTCPLRGARALVDEGDARERLAIIGKRQQFKLCVTSPPYLNSFDYTDVYRPELFLGKWVAATSALRKIRVRTIRSHVQVKWEEPITRDFGRHFDNSIAELLPRQRQLWNGRIPLMIQAYFEDMRCVLTGLRECARHDASIWMVVSTSAYAGVEVPVDLIIADIAAKCGWYLRELSVLRYLSRVAVQQWMELNEKKENKPHLRESVIILDAAPRQVLG